MDDTLLPFPFAAIVGQGELKTALVLGLINERIGGVLLIGPYGVGKTLAVRSLLDLMPLIPADDGGRDRSVRMRLVELPLNARMEDVVGGVNERVAIEQQRVLIEDGVLARAHRNLLYIDEVNLLDARVADAILDAAAQGRTFVRRGAYTKLYPSQFVLVGSMNPEEGRLRPQIMDRFGLRVWVTALEDAEQRLEIVRRSRDFRTEPDAFRAQYAAESVRLNDDIAASREILAHVTLPDAVARFGLACIAKLAIVSHRAEIALFEAARARAAADFRAEVTEDDVRHVAPLAFRQRTSAPLTAYAAEIATEQAMIEAALGG